MKAFVRGLLARANEVPKIHQRKVSAGFGCLTSPPPPEKGLENLTVADVLSTKDTDIDTWISCRTNDTVSDAVKNVRSNFFLFLRFYCLLITLHTHQLVPMKTRFLKQCINFMALVSLICFWGTILYLWTFKLP